MASPTIVDMMSRSAPMGKKKNWVKGAVKHPGAFTAEAEKAGESVHQYAEEKKDAGGTLGKRANMALTFEGMAHKHSKRRKAMYG